MKKFQETQIEYKKIKYNKTIYYNLLIMNKSIKYLLNKTLRHIINKSKNTYNKTLKKGGYLIKHANNVIESSKKSNKKSNKIISKNNKKYSSSTKYKSSSGLLPFQLNK